MELKTGKKKIMKKGTKIMKKGTKKGSVWRTKMRYSVRGGSLDLSAGTGTIEVAQIPDERYSMY